MKRISYVTSGTCSKQIDLEVGDDGKILNVVFTGGCNGNLQGICSLVKGMHVDDVWQHLNGIRCGSKPTSCPDQLCKAIEQLKQM